MKITSAQRTQVSRSAHVTTIFGITEILSSMRTALQAGVLDGESAFGRLATADTQDRSAYVYLRGERVLGVSRGIPATLSLLSSWLAEDAALEAHEAAASIDSNKQARADELAMYCAQQGLPTGLPVEKVLGGHASTVAQIQWLREYIARQSA